MPEVARPLTKSMLDRQTPKEVDIRTEAPHPVDDPTLGIVVPPTPGGRPRNRLVTIGDSLTHGFQSGAIFATDLSWPMIVAWEMGWDSSFRRPQYPEHGGLPVNIEYLLRRLEQAFGAEIGPFELPGALFLLRNVMAEIEHHWERGPGKEPPVQLLPNHNLAVYGWDLRDAFARNAGFCRERIGVPRNNVFNQVIENANERAALRVLASDPAQPPISPVDGALRLGLDGDEDSPGVGDGIETLVVFLGANNSLGSVLHLAVRWSSDPDYKDLLAKQRFTVWNPQHFKAELDELVSRVSQIRARHVIFATVPHVTVAPIARGVGSDKVEPGSRYYPYYTRPWIADRDFDPQDDPHLTSQQARAIDSAIDQYNLAIVDVVRKARQAKRSWFVFDACGMLDRLATRRYLEDPHARPSWWTPYPLPDALAVLRPAVDTCFFTSGPLGRLRGGLFSLDGVHPTTIGYGLIAQEVIKIMQLAGVRFYLGDGVTERTGPVKVDFQRLLALDTLMSAPPRSLSSDLRLIGWLDQKLDVFRRLLPG